jgi:L-lactate dehydrogenase complex protein LldE
LCDHNDQRATTVRKRTLELSEFLTQVLKVDKIPGKFPHQVGLHQSCHGLRELRLGPSSEVMKPREGFMESLLAGLGGIRFSSLSRRDECCGFGGTFAVAEEAISCMMGDDRVNDHMSAGTEVLTAGDMSCLMHLEGIIRRRKVPMRVMHFAEILAEAVQAE